MRDVESAEPAHDHIGAGADGAPALIGGVCVDCGTCAFPRAPVCPACGGERIDPKPLPRHGTLYSFTILHVGAPAPRAFGYVDLADGVRVFSRLLGAQFRIDQTVRLKTGDPSALYAFTPEAG